MRVCSFSGRILTAVAILGGTGFAVPAAADVFFTIQPCRVYDSRVDLAGPLVFNSLRMLPVGGVCGIPANASTVSLNESAVGSTASGWLFAFPGAVPTFPGHGFPFRPGKDRARMQMVDLGAGGSMSLLACAGENPSTCAGAGALDVLLDVNGYFLAGAVASPDVATVPEDSGPTAIDVLANDNDGGAGAFAIASATDPANGTVVLTGGSPGAHTGLTYQPDPNYCNSPPGTSPDTFSYTLTPSGHSTTVSVTVTCVDDAPVAVDDAATVAEDAGASAIPVLANDTDPDAGPISITGVTQPANGAVVITGGGTGLTYAPNAGYCNTPPGTSLDTFTYTLTPGGTSATVTMTVTCFDDAPVAVADAATVIEDAAATAVNVLANDTDTDGGPKAVGSVTQPANGTVVITGGGAGLTYQPNANYCNTPPGTTLDVFTYTLTPGSSSTTVTMTVTCVDDDPTAVDDAATVAEDSGATAVPVLSNDTDPDGGAIAIQSVTQPANGTVVITGGGTGLTYQPTANYCNTPPGTALDTFTYTVTPGGDSATVSMTVTCVDDNPVAVNDAAAVGEDSGPTAVPVLANDTDIDAGPKSIQSVTQPANGTVVITGGGTGLTYQPNTNYCNNPPGTTPDTFTYTLTPGGSSATVSMTVNCGDDSPVAVADAATVAEDSGASAVNVLANDTDLDGGPISILSVTQPTNGAVVITGGGTGLTYQPNANYCNTPPGSSLDVFTYTLTPGGSSTSVTMSVTCVNDGPTVDLNGPTPAGTSFTVTFTEGDPAVLLDDGVDPDAATIVDVDSTTMTTLTVTLTNLIDATFEVLDANVSSFPNIMKAYDTITTPGTGVLTLSGVGPQPVADFQSVLRTVTYRNTDNNPDNTARIVNFVANDGATNGNTAVSTVTVVPVDSNPVAVADSATVAEDSGATAVNVLANDTDADGGPISITSVTQPANGAVVITGGGTGLTYQSNPNYCNTPPGTTLDVFTYTLTPGSSSTTVTMTVTCVDDNPVAVADSATVAEDSGASAIPVLANDTDADGGPISITSVTQSANGAVVITGGGTGLTYQPNLNYCNTPPGTTLDVFTYTLTPGGSSTTVTMTVSCVDDNPVAVADAATVVEDSGANAINVLANDTDVDAGPKSVGSVTQPANGSVLITGGGTGLTYQPNPNYCNTPPGTTLDTFTYTLTPGGSSTMVTVSVTCVDDPPIAVADSATVNEDSGANAIAVLANDTDIDAGPKSIASVTQPANGTVVITGGGTGLTYAPNLNYCNNPPGTTLDTFTYTLTPTSATPTATVTMTVTCVNDPPVADADLFDYIGNTQLEVDQDTASTPEVLETTPSTFGVIDGDSDPVENNSIAISAIVGCADVTAPFVCPLAGIGTVTMEANGRFGFDPLAGDTGAAATGCAAGAADKETFQYTLTDNGLPSPASATGTVTLCRFERVWYVKNDGAAGNGTSASPINALAAANIADTSGDGDLTDDLDAAGDYIFVYFGNGTDSGQNAGLQLEASQRLLGQFAGLSIPVALNGNGSPTVLVAAPGVTDCSGGPCRPLLSHTAGNAVTASDDNGGGAPAIGTIPTEIVGMSLQGSANAIDLTTTAALSGSSSLTILQNVFRGAGAEGVDVNLEAGTTGTLNLAVTNNSWASGTHAGNAVDISRAAGTLNLGFNGNTGIRSNASAVVIAGGAVANTTVTGFAGNSVHQVTGGAGVMVSNVTFDAVAGGAVTQVDGDNLAIGVEGDPVGAAGMSLTTVQGNLFFDDLDILAGTSGLTISGTGTGMTFGVPPASGGGTSKVKASAGAAVDVTSTALDLRLSEMVSTTTAGGVNLSTVSGQFSVPSCGAGCAITKGSGTGTAFTVASSNATVAYGGTLNVTSGAGVSLTNNAGSTMSFTGGMTLSTGTNVGFGASGGGTVTVTDPVGPVDNTITTGTGTALSLSGVSGNVAFTSLTATNGAAIATSNLTGGPVTVGTVTAGGTNAGVDAITFDGTGVALDLSIGTATINTNAMDDGIVLSDLGSGSDVTISAGTITSTGAGRRVFELGGSVNCNCNLSAVTLNANSSDGISLGATHTGTYQFGDADINTPNGGIGVQVVGDANAANTDSSVTFKSVDINTCSNTGIFVHSHSGSFTVLGTGTANSGGTIQSCTARGARFGQPVSASTGAKSITLSDMLFSGNGTANLDPAGTCGDNLNGTNTNCAAGIDLQNADTVTLARVHVSGGLQQGINGKNVTALTLTNVEVNNAGNETNESGIQLHNLFGTSTWGALNLHDNASRQLNIQNSTATAVNLTINSSTFANTSWPGSTTSAQGILFSGTNNAQMTISVQNSTIARNFGPAFQSDSASSADINATVNGGSLVDNGQHFVIASTGNGNMTYALTNVATMWVDPAHSGVTPISIAMGDGASGTFNGTIQGNTIGLAAVANSGAPCSGCNVISLRNNGSNNGLNRCTIGGAGAGQANIIRRSGGGGINVTSGLNVNNDSGTIEVKILNNTLTAPDGGGTGLPITVVNGTAAADTSETCANILNNNIAGTGGSGTWNMTAAVRLRHVQNTTQYRLPGYGGAGGDTTAVQNYLDGRNTLNGGASAVAVGAGTFVGGGDCF